MEWLEKRHPEFIRQLQKMVKRGQIEIIGGGYYEPILTTIPQGDALGQIRLLNQKIEALFGIRPKGLWMAERAWEPSSPELFAQSRIKYTILDDMIFHLSGVLEEEYFFPYFVESRGSSVVIFPSLKKLRYFIPFKPVSKTISYLRKNHGNDVEEEEQGKIAVYGDDGEKFGAWPTTYEEVYAGGWLNSFFEHLALNQNWLETVLLSDYLSTANVSRRIHLPAASYSELMQWSIPLNIKRRHPVNDGVTGFWRLFLSKYPESGELYAKMLSVSRIIDHFHGSDEIKRQARIELWKAQYNDVYWHGIFGGLYFPKFRFTAYHHLIRAQSLIESFSHDKKKNWISIQYSNENLSDSVVINNTSLGLTIKPSIGGCVTEIDFKPVSVNLTDVLARHYESYHRKIMDLERSKVYRRQRKGITSIHELSSLRERGLGSLLVYDRYPKASFLDYVLMENTTIDDFRRQKFVELAHFAGYPYDFEKKSEDDAVSFTLSRKSSLKHNGGAYVNLKKTIIVDSSKSGFSVDYDLDRALLGTKFATEINLGSFGDDLFEKTFGRLSRPLQTDSVKFRYPKLGFFVKLDFSRKISVWLIPIRTVSKSESGFESNLQGISVVPNFDLNDYDSTRFKVFLSIERS